MSNRTYVCLKCKKTYRQDAALDDFKCPVCKGNCISVHHKIHIPSPKRVRKWNMFWEKYLDELRQLENFRKDPNQYSLRLEILNQHWFKNVKLVERWGRWFSKIIKK